MNRRGSIKVSEEKKNTPPSSNTNEMERARKNASERGESREGPSFDLQNNHKTLKIYRYFGAFALEFFFFPHSLTFFYYYLSKVFVFVFCSSAQSERNKHSEAALCARYLGGREKYDYEQIIENRALDKAEKNMGARRIWMKNCSDN